MSTLQKITTYLMFEGKAQEAMRFYTSLFADSEIRSMTRYGPGEAGTEGTVAHASFVLSGQPLMCIDSPASHEFGWVNDQFGVSWQLNLGELTFGGH